jgi:hypothetical protein
MFRSHLPGVFYLCIEVLDSMDNIKLDTAATTLVSRHATK